MSEARPLTLERRADAVYASGGSLAEPVAVLLVYARPISARDRQISILDAKKKREIAWLESIDDFDPASRPVAEEALYDRYRISLVESVAHSFVNHGHRYLKVQTNRGFRYFNLKEPGKNVTHITADHLVIRDSMGNRYEIKSLQALDSESRQRLELVL
jgi:hypothetical protein